MFYLDSPPWNNWQTDGSCKLHTWMPWGNLKKIQLSILKISWENHPYSLALRTIGGGTDKVNYKVALLLNYKFVLLLWLLSFCASTIIHYDYRPRIPYNVKLWYKLPVSHTKIKKSFALNEIMSCIIVECTYTIILFNKLFNLN